MQAKDLRKQGTKWLSLKPQSKGTSVDYKEMSL